MNGKSSDSLPLSHIPPLSIKANLDYIHNTNFFSFYSKYNGWKRSENYDLNGDIANLGMVNKTVLNKYWNIFKPTNLEQVSYDINDFNISFSKNLSLEDGAATLTHHTAKYFFSYFKNNKKLKEKIILCGGGRKNKFLVNLIKSHNKNVKLIDNYDIDGDFVESQAFAYLAIRSFLKLPISFPSTTGCKKPCTGGVLVKNY